MNLSFKRAFAIFALIGLTACAPGNMFDGEGSGEVIAPETPLVVADGEYPTRMNQVSVGQPHLTSAQLPAVFETVDAEPNCRMPRPSRDAKLAYVYTYGGGVKTPLHYIADGADAEQIAARMAFTKEVAKQVAREGGFVEGAVARQFASFAKGNSVEWATRVDVLVTETEAPVFLVLTSYNAILWNIQLAPGAQIDGIVVSAYEGGASARRTGFMGFDGSPNRSCRLDGRGKPVPTEVRIAGAKDLNPDFDPRGYKERWDAEYRDAQKFFSVDLRQKSASHQHGFSTTRAETASRPCLSAQRPMSPLHNSRSLGFRSPPTSPRTGELAKERSSTLDWIHKRDRGIQIN